jgi:hypothetical protein
VLADFGGLEGVTLSVVTPTGTDINSERYCETQGRNKKAQLLKRSSPKRSSMSFNMTLFDRTEARLGLQGFSGLDFPLIWRRPIFRPFPRFKKVSADVTTLRRVKSRQRMGCAFLTKLNGCIATQ